MSLGHQVVHVKVVTIEGVRPAGLVCRACRVEIVDIVWKLVYGYGKEHGVGLGCCCLWWLRALHGSLSLYISFLLLLLLLPCLLL